ncbi:MAG TPA: segregation/condensation protein A [Gammaproteobacteria bacterium]|nr:segregation/condensation protein A [Gammaproteobacteria bacterium]
MDRSPDAPAQAEMPFAIVQGEPLTVLPQDLYIPPDALEVILEAFEGPLDLLLYLIKRQNIDILDIPIARVTEQYMEYIALMQNMRFELAAEYLVMAAMLAEIKSRMLLPKPESSDDEDDPRAELIRRLQEYERYKLAAEDLDALPRLERDTQLTACALPLLEKQPNYPDIDLKELLFALQGVLKRADMYTHHNIEREALSVRERMTRVLSVLSADEFAEFSQLFDEKEGRIGVVVTFLAVLELVKEALAELVQAEPFAQIYVRARGSANVVDRRDVERDD